MQPDRETGLRITANPLMLSMIASICELRQGMEMPQTEFEIYEMTMNAMQSRSKQARGNEALVAIFFETHISEQRIITQELLDAAAERLDDKPEVDEWRARVMRDEMPLVSLRK